MNERVRILLIDDDEEEYILLKELVSGQAKHRTLHQYDLDWVSTYDEALREFLVCQYDVYLVDFHLGGHSGLELLNESVVRGCPAPVIMLTGQGSYETDLSAMQLGAADYLEKNQLSLPLLEHSISYAIERKQAEKILKKKAQELEALQKATSSLLQTLDLSSLMGRILDAARQAIPLAEQGRLYLIRQQRGKGIRLNEMPFTDPRINMIKLPENLGGEFQKILEGQPLLIADIQAEPSLLAQLNNRQQYNNVRSSISVPLFLDQEFIGTLTLSASQPSVFSQSDLQLLSSFAVTAMAAIHNAILYKETQDLAITDPLTGQLNRRTLFEMGQREIERSQRFGHPLSWIMFDVDRFKHINDTYGHLAGDQVLNTVVERCCRIIRHVDILGRYGGDEFVIALPETDHRMAGEIAERIRTYISASPIVTEAGAISVSVSMGITQTTPETADLGLLLNKADQALYRSKRSGRNKITVLL